MESGFWASRKGKRGKKFTDETHNRAGHWTRTFSVRQESWSVIEHWASEHGFHLTAIKGRRRLYRRGYQQSFFLTFLDIRHDESSITLTGWIEVGLLARALSLFTLPRELQIEPRGLNGIMQRRQACREVNLLLDRLKQPAILGSTGLHVGDLDLTTIGLFGIFGFFVFVFIYSSINAFEVRPGLAQALLATSGNSLLILGILALVLIAAHHFIAIRRLNRMMWRMTSVAAASLIFAITTIVLVSQSAVNAVDLKVHYYCVEHPQRSMCEGILAQLSPRDREIVLKRIQNLEKQLTFKPSP